MTDWLKRFALSFFSDKHMGASAHHGFGMTLLTCVLSIVIVFFGIFIGKDMLFAVDYGGADEFKSFIYRAFVDDDGLKLGVDVVDGKADVTVDGKRAVINTVADGGGYGGYHLIVDYNDMTEAYDDFSVQCVSDGATVSYEEYCALSASERKNYTVEIKYSGTAKTITKNDVAMYEEYLDERAADELKKLAQQYSDSAYDREVYKLYVKYYYPDLKALTGEETPTLKKYYYNTIDRTDGKYLCVFGDMIIGSFENRFGKKVSFGCVYNDGKLYSAPNAAAAQKALDDFIVGLYNDNLSTLLFLEIVNGVLYMLLAICVIVSAALYARLLSKIKRLKYDGGFLCCFKAVGSCVHIAALLSACATVVLGFFIGGALLTALSVLSFAAAIAARVTVFYIRESARQKKASESEIDLLADVE